MGYYNFTANLTNIMMRGFADGVCRDGRSAYCRLTENMED